MSRCPNCTDLERRLAAFEAWREQRSAEDDERGNKAAAMVAELSRLEVVLTSARDYIRAEEQGDEEKITRAYLALKASLEEFESA